MRKSLLLLAIAGMTGSGFAQSISGPQKVLDLFNLKKESKIARSSAPLIPGSILYLNWNGSTMAWDTTYLSTYNYNSDNNYNWAISQVYDTTTGSFINESKNQYYYTGTRLDSMYQYAWQTNAWVLQAKAFATYTGAGKFNEVKIYFDYTMWGFGWILAISQQFYYDINDHPVALVAKQASGPPMWTMDYSDSSAYVSDVNDNILSEEEFSWNSSSWDKVRRISSTFNTNNELLTEMGMSWTGSVYQRSDSSAYAYNIYDHENYREGYTYNMGAWNTGSRTNTYYSGPSVLDYDLRENYVSGIWYNSEKNIYDPSLPTLVKNVSTPKFSMFPNPVSSSLIVILNSLENSAKVIIKDLSGRPVFRKEFSHVNCFSIEAGDLAPGAYLLNIEIEGKNQIRKFVKL